MARQYSGRQRGISHRHIPPSQVTRIVLNDWIDEITRCDGKQLTEKITAALENEEYFGRVPIDQETGDLAEYILAHHQRDRFTDFPSVKLVIDTAEVQFELPADFVEKYPIVMWTHSHENGRHQFDAPSNSSERIPVSTPVVEFLCEIGAVEQSDHIDPENDWFLPVTDAGEVIQALETPSDDYSHRYPLDTEIVVIGDTRCSLTEFQHRPETVSKSEFPEHITHFISVLEANSISWEPTEDVSNLLIGGEVVRIVAPEELGIGISVSDDVDVVVCYLDSAVTGVEESSFDVVPNPSSTVFPQAIVSDFVDSMTVQSYFEGKASGE